MYVVLPSVKRDIITTLHTGQIKEFIENYAMLIQDPQVLQIHSAGSLVASGGSANSSDCSPTDAALSGAASLGINRGTDNDRETGNKCSPTR